MWPWTLVTEGPLRAQGALDPNKGWITLAGSPGGHVRRPCGDHQGPLACVLQPPFPPKRLLQSSAGSYRDASMCGVLRYVHRLLLLLGPLH